MKKFIILIIIALLILIGAIAFITDNSLETIEEKYPLMGFSTSPPELTGEAYIGNFNEFLEISDIALIHEETVWTDAEINQKIQQYKNYKQIANNKKLFIMIGPLHPTDRGKIAPQVADKTFADPDVRETYSKLILSIAEEVQPDYFGIGAEINGYQKTEPEDFQNFVSLYNELYPKIKSHSQETKVFVSFQYENLLGLWDQSNPQWEIINDFNELDLFAISTYPYTAFTSVDQIPQNYYSQIKQRTNLQIAIAEAGYPSATNNLYTGSETEQQEFFNILEQQIFHDLEFITYFQYRDYDVNQLKAKAREIGIDDGAVDLFASIGLINFDTTEKSAHQTWINLREKR